MKKLLILVLAITTMVNVNAQGPKKKDSDKKKKKVETWFSFMGGFHGSTFTGDSPSYSDPLIGIELGVIGNLIQLNEMISVRAEVNYSMQGAKYSEYMYGSGKVRTGYINIPVVGRYQIPMGFFGELGVQPGFLISAKDKYSGQSTDIKEDMNKFDFGIPVGGGYEFKNNVGVGYD